MLNKRETFSVGLFLFFSITAWSQPSDIDFSRLQHIGMDQGLSSNKVNCIFQDKKGFMWIGTDYGLNRYDGYNFKVFLKNPDDSLSLTDNNIKCLTQDANGNLWIGTSHGLNVMNYKTGKIMPFISEKNKIEKVWTFDITALAAEANNIWFGTNSKGFFQYNISENKLIKFLDIDPGINQFDSLQLEKIITTIEVDSKGNVWVGASMLGVFVIYKATGTIKLFPLKKRLVSDEGYKKTYYSSNYPSQLFIDNSDNIFVPTMNHIVNTHQNKDAMQIDLIDGGRLFMMSKGDSFFHEILHSNYENNVFYDIECMAQYKPDKILFVSGQGECGIMEVNKDNPYLLKAKLFKNSKNADIYQIFKDKNEKLWFSTWRGFETMDLISINATTIDTKGALIDILHEDKNTNIWIGTENRSLLLLDKPNNALIQCEKEISKDSTFLFVSSGNSNSIFGTRDEGDAIWEYDNKKKIFKRFIQLDKKGDTLNWDSFMLHPISDGNICVQTDSGFGILNPDNRIISYVIPGDTIKSASDGQAWFDNRKGSIWICESVRQVFKLNYLKRTYEVFDLSKKMKLPEEMRIRSMSEDSSGNLWLGSRGKGLFAYNFKKQKIYHFSMTDGLPTNKVIGLVYSNGALWSSYQNAIYKFIPPKNLDDPNEKPTIKTFGAKDGLPNIDFSAEAMIRCHDGRILFAADTTLISFHPDSIKSNEYAPPIVITKMQVNNYDVEAGDSTKILFNNISSTDTVHLSYLQNTLSFEFVALNYIHPEENEYAYRLEGEGTDTTWTYCGKRRFVSYSNLAPGEYVFSVKGSNNDGVWNEAGTTLHIIITPPYWQTAWFRILFVCGLGLTAYGIYRWRTRTLRNEKRKLEQKVEERTSEIVKQKTEIEKQKQKSDDLLLNILPAEVMEELKSTGKTQARNYDLVTVLFADFKDFTQIIDELPPEELVAGIDHYFETFDKIVGKFEIEKIKTVGDAYICAAGLPMSSNNNPLVMMDVAFEMLSAIEQLKKSRSGEGKIVFDVRIGVHSGPLVAGVVGIKKFSYDIWGDTVNTAARMQQHGEPGKINISGTTFGLVKHRFKCEHRGSINVKHKGPIDMYFVNEKK